MTLTLEIVLVVSSILMTVFVLLHKGKGGGLSSLFGGGVQANLSGSTTVEKNLDRVHHWFEPDSRICHAGAAVGFTALYSSAKLPAHLSLVAGSFVIAGLRRPR